VSTQPGQPPDRGRLKRQLRSAAAENRQLASRFADPCR